VAEQPGGAARRPPRLLLTLLGDYWWRRVEPLPSAALVSLLGEFGVSDAAARAALSRLTRNGLLVASRSGRRTYHRLSERAAEVLDEGATRIFSFGRTTRPWDGTWSVVAFSVPERDRPARHALRERLRWLGFAPLYDGLWVAPWDHGHRAVTHLAELGIANATVFRASTVPGARRLPQHAWDLDDLHGRYRAFIATANALAARISDGEVPPADALVARTHVMDQWRAFPALDPELPDDLLPPHWPRGEARRLFIATYDRLGPLAVHRVRQIIAAHAPELAAHATYHDSDADLADRPS
jgi:phenylacetic acid degradation operon negative regulatory protein